MSCWLLKAHKYAISYISTLADVIFFFLVVNKNFTELYFSKNKVRHQIVHFEQKISWNPNFPYPTIKKGRKIGRKEGKEKRREEEKKEESSFIFSRNTNVSKVEKYKHIFHYVKRSWESKGFTKLTTVDSEKRTKQCWFKNYK